MEMLWHMAVYMERFEQNAPKMGLKSPGFYQICAAAIARHIDEGILPIEFMAFNAVREMVRDDEITFKIQQARGYHFPELDELMNRLQYPVH